MVTCGVVNAVPTGLQATVTIVTKPTLFKRKGESCTMYWLPENELPSEFTLCIRAYLVKMKYRHVNPGIMDTV